MDVTVVKANSHNRQNAKHYSSRRWKTNMANSCFCLRWQTPLKFCFIFIILIITPITLGHINTAEFEQQNRNETQISNPEEQPTNMTTDEFPPRFEYAKMLRYEQQRLSGDNLQLACPALGNPEPELTWSRNGTEIYLLKGRISRTKWYLRLANLMPEDSDIYICKACNPHGCVENSFKLIIADRINRRPIILAAPQNLTVVLNDSGELQCDNLADVYGTLTWSFTPCNSSAGCAINRTQIIKDTNILQFDSYTYAHEGWYTCIGLDSLGTESYSAYLHVVESLETNDTSVTEIVRSKRGLPLQEDNNTAEFEQQKRNEMQISNAEEQPNNMIVESTTDEYPPRFKNPKNLLNIQSKPSGSYIQLSCPALGNPEPELTWSRNGTKVYRQMGRIKETKWAIKMEDLVPEDSDIYTCKACNPHGCIEHSIKLIVTDRVNHKPIILTAPQNLTLVLNDSGEMKCEYLSDLHSSLAWTFTPCNSSAGCAVNRTVINKDENVLQFENVTYADEGWYTCVGLNSLGTESSSAYLRVVESLEPNDISVTKIVRSHAMWVAIVVTVIVLLLLLSTIFIVYVLRKLKHEKLLKQRIETVQNWTKKVIIYKPTNDDSSGSMDTMIMPIVKIEKQFIKSNKLQSSNSEPAPPPEYEFPLDSNWEIPRNQLILGATLGEGAFGRVVKAEVNNTIVAVKMVKEGHTDDDLASLVREMEVMKIIGKNINIINLLGCCSQNGPLYVVVEFALHGNLKDFLYKHRPPQTSAYNDYNEQNTLTKRQEHLTEKHLISFAFQIARGMEYLASRRCIHRDLAARNVLVSDDYIMKIADFGLARDIQDTDYYRKNTNGRLPIKWMAPESLLDKFYDSQSDVWSYGILLWEIMTFGAQPYPTIMSAEELYSYLISGQRMDKPSKCSLNIYMLMRQCWHFDASARPTFSEIVENLDKLLLANEDYLDVAIANLDTPPSSSEDESDVESLRYHYK